MIQLYKENDLHHLQFDCPKTWGIIASAIMVMLVVIEISISLFCKIIGCIRRKKCIKPESKSEMEAQENNNCLTTLIPVVTIIPPTPAYKKVQLIPSRRNPRLPSTSVIPEINIIPLTPMKQDQALTVIPDINIIPATPIKEESDPPSAPARRDPPILGHISESGLETT